MTHTAQDCPAYNPEMMPKMLASLEKLDELCIQLNIKCHFLVEGAPEHVSYALVEADDSAALLPFVTSIPMRQDFKVTVVHHARDLGEHIKAMMAQA